MRAIGLVLLLSGCGAPISNSVFYAEAAYLDALPTSTRFAAPQAFLDAPDGDDPLLVGAESAAADLRDLLGPMDVCGAALVAATPDERGDTYRTWDDVPVLVPTSEGTFEWWVRGTVVKDASGAYTWTLDGATSRIGPWVELATGRHEASRAGQVIWRLDHLGTLVGVDMPGVLAIQYVYDGTSYGVQIQHLPDPLATDPDAYWALRGSALVSWTAPFQVTTDGTTLPGLAIAGISDTGGRADGYVWRDANTRLVFDDCWDPDGHTTFQGGDDGTAQSGSGATCVMDSLLTQSNLP